MRLIVTGGGTGGHVLPALEVALLARERGHDIHYIGSFRGQEAKACASAKVPYAAVNAVPLGRLTTPGGLLSAVRLLNASRHAGQLLRQSKPNIVFSTGGYSASPVLFAAKRLRLPVVIHEQNTVAGKTHKLAAKFAAKKCIVFDQTKDSLGADCVRTGMPIRRQLTAAATSKTFSESGICTLALGGSQGAAALNEAVFSAAMHINGQENSWVHISGEKLYESAAKSADRLGAPPSYKVRPYLEAAEMAGALSRADVAIARSGAGVICELALFGIPMILIPYPTAFANHQYHNAKVIEELEGGAILEQTQLTPETLEANWRIWTTDPERRCKATSELRAWSIPDATERVLAAIEETNDAHKS